MGFEIRIHIGCRFRIATFSSQANQHFVGIMHRSAQTPAQRPVHGLLIVVGDNREEFGNQIAHAAHILFRGALDCRATVINEEMKKAAAFAIASLITEDELKPDYIIPSPFDKRVAPAVAKAVKEAAVKTGVNRI